MENNDRNNNLNVEEKKTNKKTKNLDPTHTESFQKPTPETAFHPKTVLKYYKAAVLQPDVNPIMTRRGIWSLNSGNDAIPVLFCFFKVCSWRNKLS